MGSDGNFDCLFFLNKNVSGHYGISDGKPAVLTPRPVSVCPSDQHLPSGQLAFLGFTITLN